MITIQGHSDDIVEVLQDDEADEIDCLKGGAVITVGDEKGGLRAFVRYAVGGKRGVWRIAVEPFDEDVPMGGPLMPWEVTLAMADNGYSPVLKIDCPAGTPVKKAKTRGAS